MRTNQDCLRADVVGGEFVGSIGRGVLGATAALACLCGSAQAQLINLDALHDVLGGGDGCEREFTDEFFLDKRVLGSTGRNMFFSLRPCYRLILEGEDDGELVRLEITCMPQTRLICIEEDDRPICVRTRVIEEREYKDGVLFEVSLNYYARDRKTNDILYFGEDVCFYDENGDCVSTDGSWLAGVDGAEPGIIMPGTFLLGSAYYQEIAPDVALDRAYHAEMDLEVEVPAGTFDDCVFVLEDSDFEPGVYSEKTYAPGVGLISDGELELIWFGQIDGCSGSPDATEEE